MDLLIVGLGNPGKDYTKTRHNIAWQAIDSLSYSSDLRWKEKFKGQYAQYDDIAFLKPMTFMNLSGDSVWPCAKFFKIEVDSILVIQDELDLPYGTIMFKEGGGLAGHNGLKSIANKLGSQDFHRLRLGIGRPQYGDVSSYVLSKFSADEEARLGDYFKLSEEAISFYRNNGIKKASNQYNRASIN